MGAETAETFHLTEDAKGIVPKLQSSIEALAAETSFAMIDAGHTLRQASSITARLFIEEAWSVACTSAIADGRTPDPDLFRVMVEEIIARASSEGSS